MIILTSYHLSHFRNRFARLMKILDLNLTILWCFHVKPYSHKQSEFSCWAMLRKCLEFFQFINVSSPAMANSKYRYFGGKSTKSLEKSKFWPSPDRMVFVYKQFQPTKNPIYPNMRIFQNLALESIWVGHDWSSSSIYLQS